MTARLLTGDCLALMRPMPDNGFDSIVTDPPAGISFMGATWDGDKGGRKQWTAWMTEVLAEALRVVKPGGHALVWALPRTSHWTGWAAEEAGWESRDVLHHLFYSGMPKGGSIGPHIDRLAGAEREVIGKHPNPAGNNAGGTSLNMSVVGMPREALITAPATPDAIRWEGWHTHLKPAVEHWHLLRKPLGESTIARNVLKWGTGALNIDGCRIAQGSDIWPGPQEKAAETHSRRVESRYGFGSGEQETHTTDGQLLGRYPANLVHFRKPSRKEKEAGCGGLPVMSGTDIRNGHPTPKRIEQMQWLCRLVTPPGGDILDMFGGSGTTGIGASLGGFDVTLCELDPAFVDIARARIKHWVPAQQIEGGTDPEPTGPQTTLF